MQHNNYSLLVETVTDVPNLSFNTQILKAKNEFHKQHFDERLVEEVSMKV